MNTHLVPLICALAFCTEVTANNVWLQIIKQGNNYTGYYSFYRVNWDQVCTAGDMSFTHLKVG
ncbi:MAG: hypothetical protein GYA34_03340 [Chloroflexi bacterium]|nr:hypothetical protein [Chloroflexota bacterium]